MPTSLRLYFNYDSRPTDDWTINLEYDYDEALAAIEIDEQTQSLVDGFVPALLDNVIIDRAVWSTWQPDSEPYNPLFVRTIPIGVPGARTFTLTAPVDDDLSVLARKQTTTGRNGSMHIGGALLVANVTASQGSWEIVPVDLPDFQDYISGIDAALSANLPCALVGVSLMEIQYPATAEGVKQVPIRVYQDDPTVRLVSDLVLVGPTERQRKQ